MWERRCSMRSSCCFQLAEEDMLDNWTAAASMTVVFELERCASRVLIVRFISSCHELARNWISDTLGQATVNLDFACPWEGDALMRIHKKVNGKTSNVLSRSMVRSVRSYTPRGNMLTRSLGIRQPIFPQLHLCYWGCVGPLTP